MEVVGEATVMVLNDSRQLQTADGFVGGSEKAPGIRLRGSNQTLVQQPQRLSSGSEGNQNQDSN